MHRLYIMYFHYILRNALSYLLLLISFFSYLALLLFLLSFSLPLPASSFLPSSFFSFFLFVCECVSVPQWVLLGLFTKAWTPYHWLYQWRCLSLPHPSVTLCKSLGCSVALLALPIPQQGCWWVQFVEIFAGSHSCCENSLSDEQNSVLYITHLLPALKS